MTTQDILTWESWEALDEAIGRDTVAVAHALHISPRLVRAWKEIPATEEDYTQSGARNPLDRLAVTISTIEKKNPERAYVPIKWLNARFGFLAIKLPEPDAATGDVQKSLLGWTREFGETCAEVSSALADGRVSKPELKRIRGELMDDMEAGFRLLAMLRSMNEGTT